MTTTPPPSTPRNPRRHILTTSATLAALTTAAAVHAGSTLTLHVDDDAPAGGDGLSWDGALRDLQDAIQLGRQTAQTDDTVRRINILIAQGTYKPDSGTGDVSRRFVLDFPAVPGSAVRGIDVWGGYAGVGAPDPALHDPQAFPTVLSGDLNGDDQPGFVNYDDNSNGVVAALAVNSSSIALFGLTIRGGNANGDGGGLSVSEGDCYAIDCVIEENRAANEGGGIFVDGGGSFTVVSSLVRRNEALHGGGLFVDGLSRSAAVIAKSTLSGNRAIAGGGLYLDWGAGSTLSRSGIVGNHAVDGAGMFINGRINCYDSLIADNQAAGTGGGLCVHWGGRPAIYSTTIANNVAWNGPAAAYFGTETREPIEGSIIWGNTARNGGTGQMQLWGVSAGSTPELVRNILQGGAEGIELNNSGPAITQEVLDADPLFVDPDGPNDDPEAWQDNDYSLQAASPAIDRGGPARRALDLLGNIRTIDVPLAGDGQPWPTDMGAIEYVACPCEIDGDHSTTPADLLLYLDLWFDEDLRAERDGDPYFRINVFDLLAFLDCWFAPTSTPPCP